MSRKLPKVRPIKGDGFALVDIEIIVFHVCMEALEERYIAKFDEYSWHLNHKDAFLEVMTRVRNIMRETNTSSAIGAVGGGGLWRKKVSPSYKAHRPKKKPLGYGAVMHLVGEEITILKQSGLEADDVLGILHTSPDKPGRTVLVSSDKDMKTIPGLLYDPTCPDQGVIVQSVEEADRWHYIMTLVGDTADGYPGCKGVGKTRAPQILVDCKKGEEWQTVLDLFKKAGQSEKFALEQARLARILRYGELDELGAPILWCPPKRTSSPARSKTSARSARTRGSKSGIVTKKMQCSKPSALELPKAGRKKGKRS